mgnify:FL=1
MPKAASDGVQTIRFEFQDSERQMFRDFIAGQNVVAVGKTIDDLLSFENLYIAATIYEMYSGEEILTGTPNDLGKLIEMVLDWWQKKKAQYPEDQAPHQSFALAIMNLLSTFTGLNSQSYGGGYANAPEGGWAQWAQDVENI